MSYTISTYTVQQNNQGFLLGIFPMSSLKKFVKFTHRIVIDYDDNNMPKYNEEVQRKTSNSKVDGIADFLIHDDDSFFPTNIVLSVPSSAIERLDISGNKTDIILKDVVIKETAKTEGAIFITIIDGQHRIAGIEKAVKRLTDEIRNLEFSIRSATNTDTSQFEADLAKNNKLLDRLNNFQIIATFFIDPTLEYQAMIFSTINRTQTKVSEDLVYSLFGLSTEDSPQKTSLEIALALNASEKSPFYNRIKLAGAKFSDDLPPLSQAMMVKSILYKICPNLKQAEIEKNKDREYVRDKDFEDYYLPFRRYYGNNQDSKIILIVNAFFSAAKSTFITEEGLSYWDPQTPLNILQTTVGFQSLFNILVEILKNTNEENRISKEYYADVLSKAKEIDFADAGEKKLFPFTSKSINILYNEIGRRIFSKSFVAKEIRE